jgi:hypothetical protein
MNQFDTSEEKLLAKHDFGLFFADDGDTTSPSLEPRTLTRRPVTCASTPTAAMMTMAATTAMTSGCRLIQKYLVIVYCSS